MISRIFIMNEDNSNITFTTTYSIEPKKALICFIRQLDNDYNTWNYPSDLKGIWKSTTRNNVFYYQDNKRKKIYMSKGD